MAINATASVAFLIVFPLAIPLGATMARLLSG